MVDIDWLEKHKVSEETKKGHTYAFLLSWIINYVFLRNHHVASYVACILKAVISKGKYRSQNVTTRILTHIAR